MRRTNRDVLSFAYIPVAEDGIDAANGVALRKLGTVSIERSEKLSGLLTKIHQNTR